MSNRGPGRFGRARFAWRRGPFAGAGRDARHDRRRYPTLLL